MLIHTHTHTHTNKKPSQQTDMHSQGKRRKEERGVGYISEE